MPRPLGQPPRHNPAYDALVEATGATYRVLDAAWCAGHLFNEDRTATGTGHTRDWTRVPVANARAATLLTRWLPIRTTKADRHNLIHQLAATGTITFTEPSGTVTITLNPETTTTND